MIFLSLWKCAEQKWQKPTSSTLMLATPSRYFQHNIRMPCKCFLTLVLIRIMRSKMRVLTTINKHTTLKILRHKPMILILSTRNTGSINKTESDSPIDTRIEITLASYQVLVLFSFTQCPNSGKATRTKVLRKFCRNILKKDHAESSSPHLHYLTHWQLLRNSQSLPSSLISLLPPNRKSSKF